MDTSLDVVIRAHDPARLDELDRAVFSAALSDHRPLHLLLACQRFGPAALRALQARLDPIAAIAPDVPVTVLNRPDPEPADARAALLNLGLGAGTGRFAAFLDYDDVIYPEAWRLLAAELQDSGAAVAFAAVLNAEVSRTGLVPVTLGKRRVFAGDGLHQLLHDNFCPLHSFMVDRAALAPGELHLDETLTHLEDYDLLLRLVARHPSSFRLKDTVIGEYIFKDDGSNANPLSRPGGRREDWQGALHAIERRKQALTLSPAVRASLGLPDEPITIAQALARLPPR